jgi:hypothetical protein
MGSWTLVHPVHPPQSLEEFERLRRGRFRGHAHSSWDVDFELEALRFEA